MTTFDKRKYTAKLRDIVRQLNALQPAADSFGLGDSLKRATAAVNDARIDSTL